MFDTPVLTCEDEKEISEQLTNFVVMCYNEAVEERGRFAIALTGGRAVKLLADRITREPFISYIDWTKWYVFFIDERCTSLDNPCSSYRMIDNALLQHVSIPEMQVFPAFDPALSLDKRGHTCEAAALAYERRMRAVLGGSETEVPALDVALVGVDKQGNVASLFEGHAMMRHKIRNYEVTWGAESNYRDLGPHQAVTAMYECPLDLIDIELTPQDLRQAQRRGIPAERVALTLKCLNSAHQILATVLDGEAAGPLMKEYFEGVPNGVEPVYGARGLNQLHSRAGRPRLFCHRKAIDGFIALPQLLRTFQVQDLAFSITEARETAASAEAGLPEENSDSEGEEYQLRVAREEAVRQAEYAKSRSSSAIHSRKSSKASSPTGGLTPLGGRSPTRRGSVKYSLAASSVDQDGLRWGEGGGIAEEDEGKFSRATSGGLRRARSSSSRGSHASDQVLMINDAPEQGGELNRMPSVVLEPEEGDIIIPDHFPNVPEAVRHIDSVIKQARAAAARATRLQSAVSGQAADVLSDSGSSRTEGRHSAGRSFSLVSQPNHASSTGSDSRSLSSGLGRASASVGPGGLKRTYSNQSAGLKSVTSRTLNPPPGLSRQGSVSAESAVPVAVQVPEEETKTYRLFVRAGCYQWQETLKVGFKLEIRGAGAASYRMRGVSKRSVPAACPVPDSGRLSLGAPSAAPPAGVGEVGSGNAGSGLAVACMVRGEPAAVQGHAVAVERGEHDESAAERRVSAGPSGTQSSSPGEAEAVQESVIREYTEIFQQIDGNGDGRISQIEFIRALRRDSMLALKLGLPHEIHQEDESRRLFELTFHELDGDNSKTISLSEWLRFYCPGHTAGTDSGSLPTDVSDGDLEYQVEMEWSGCGTLLMGRWLFSAESGALHRLSLACPDAGVSEPVVAFESATAEAPEGAATWVVDRSHVIIAAGRKGISAGAGTRAKFTQCRIMGCGAADGQSRLTSGLARCGIQSFDGSDIHLTDCHIAACRQAVSVFDQARVSLLRSEVHLPPDSFAVALSDSSSARLQDVVVCRSALEDPHEKDVGRGVGAHVVSCGVMWAAAGNDAELCVAACTFDVSGRDGQEEVLWGGRMSKPARFVLDFQTAKADCTKWKKQATD